MYHEYLNRTGMYFVPKLKYCKIVQDFCEKKLYYSLKIFLIFKAEGQEF